MAGPPGARHVQFIEVATASPRPWFSILSYLVIVQNNDILWIGAWCVSAASLSSPSHHRLPCYLCRDLATSEWPAAWPSLAETAPHAPMKKQEKGARTDCKWNGLEQLFTSSFLSSQDIVFSVFRPIWTTVSHATNLSLYPMKTKTVSRGLIADPSPGGLLVGRTGHCKLCLTAEWRTSIGSEMKRTTSWLQWLDCQVLGLCFGFESSSLLIICVLLLTRYQSKAHVA